MRCRCLRPATLLLACQIVAAADEAASAQLTWHGGPVVGNAQIVMVNWGDTVPAAVQAGMPAFYDDIVQSDYWTIFGEYQVSGGQRIGFGSFAGASTIAPLKCAGTAPCTLSASDVDIELALQIATGHLPVPATDAAGHVDTVYMVHFGPNVTITIPGGYQSCVQFCSAQANFRYAALTVPAGLIPDQGGGCSSLCGGGADSYLGQETQASMLALANLVTNPQAASVGAGGVLAWYDDSNGAISDICNAASDFSEVTANGNSQGVPRLWSNKAAACIVDDATYVVKPDAQAHGSIAPDTLQAVASGQTAAFTVTPDAGYVVAVGGTCGGSLAGKTYTTGPVTTDCSIEATFMLDSVFDSGFEPPLSAEQFAAIPGSLFDGLPVCIPPISANVSGYQVTACQAPQMCTPVQAGCMTALHAQAATLTGSLASGGYDIDTPATADSFTSAIDFAGLASCHVTAESIGGHVVASYAAIPDYAGCARIDALYGAEATAVNAALSSSDCGIYSSLIAYVQPYVVAQLQTELTNEINALLPKPGGPGVGDTICPAP